MTKQLGHEPEPRARAAAGKVTGRGGCGGQDSHLRRTRGFQGSSAPQKRRGAGLSERRAWRASSGGGGGLQGTPSVPPGSAGAEGAVQRRVPHGRLHEESQLSAWLGSAWLCGGVLVSWVGSAHGL